MSSKNLNYRRAQKKTPSPMTKELIINNRDHFHSDKRNRRPNQGNKNWKNEELYNE